MPPTSPLDEQLPAPPTGGTLVGQVLAAANEAEKSPFRMIWEWWGLLRGPGKLSFQDYLGFRLFDDDLYDDEARRRFLNPAMHATVLHAVSDPARWKAISDKAEAAEVLGRHDIPTPEVLAVIGGGERLETPTLDTTDALVALLVAEPDRELFLKPVFGTQSLGALRIDRYEAGTVHLAGREPMAVGELFHALLGREPSVIQPVVRNHPEVAGYADALATVRLTNFVDDPVRTEGVVFRVPARDQVADGFWRPGNALAAVDAETGQLLRAIRGRGTEQVELRALPGDNRRLDEVVLPDWRAVLELNARCVEAFGELCWFSVDIGLTPDGPTVLEITPGGRFDLPQLAHQRGCLSPENRAFWEHHGFSF